MNEFDFKKVPTFAYVLLITIVVAIIYWIFVGQSLVSNAPTMMKEHEENVAKIEEYDRAMEQKDAIENEIKKKNQTYETKQKELFVDLDTCSKELENYCTKNNIKLDNYAISEPQQDSRNRTSSAGYPVYTVDISLSYEDTYDTTLNLLKYVEKTSQGCYYVNSCSMNEGSSGDKNKFSTKVSLKLYYYDTSVVVTPTEATTQAATK